jgi:DNA-binding response OmpR family regulator
MIQCATEPYALFRVAKNDHDLAIEYCHRRFQKAGCEIDTISTALLGHSVRIGRKPYIMYRMEILTKYRLAFHPAPENPSSSVEQGDFLFYMPIAQLFLRKQQYTRTMRLLIIEDEHKIANALKKALQRESYAVDVSYDGDDGWAMASTETYDAMIIDRMIPGKYDGLRIVTELRSVGNHTPVLLLTALGSLQDKTTGLDAGADDYLVKPFALEELLARIRALVRRSKSLDEVVLTAGDLTLNTATFEVARAGKSISLTQKEYALIEYLMRNQGRILTKDMIIAHVWNYDADILPNTVEVYIKYLRKKIDKGHHSALIRTVRGFGYKLEV